MSFVLIRRGLRRNDGENVAGFARARLTSLVRHSCLCLLLAGCNAAPFTQVSDTPAGAHEPSLAPIPDGFVAAWYDTRDGHGEIYIRRLDATGRATAPERRLTAGSDDAYEADVAPTRDGVVVGWYEKGKDGHLTPKLGAFALDGTQRWARTLSPRGRNTVVRSAGGLVFAAWIEDEGDDRAGVWATWRRADGVDLIPPRRIADAGRTTWNLNAALAADSSPGNPHAWVAFDAKSGTMTDELFLVETTETRDHVVRLTPDDGAASKYPDIAFAEDRAAVTWFDTRDGNEEIYLAVADLMTLASGRITPQRITTTTGHSIGAYLAWNGDRLGLAWCDDSPGNQELYFQSFNRDARAEGPATRLTTTASSSSIPAIKPLDTGFALLWSEHDPISSDTHGGRLRSQVVFRAVP